MSGRPAGLHDAHMRTGSVKVSGARRYMSAALWARPTCKNRDAARYQERLVAELPLAPPAASPTKTDAAVSMRVAPLQSAESIQNTPGAGLRKKSGLSRFAVATNTCLRPCRLGHKHKKVPSTACGPAAERREPRPEVPHS